MIQAISFFGPFSFDHLSGRLARDGSPISLRPQLAVALGRLLESQGGLVSRRELTEALWGPERYVDSEQGINTCILHLRAVLGDDATDPTYIETVPGKGYRFIATVAAADSPTATPEGRTWARATTRALRARGGWLRPLMEPRYRLALTLFTLVSGLILIVLALATAGSGPEEQGPVRAPRVLFAGFENQTPDPDLGETLSLLLRIGLEQGRSLAFLAESELEEALLRMTRQPGERVDRKLGLEICRRKGLAALVLASCHRAGEQLVLSVEVVSPTDGRTHLATSLIVAPEDALSAVEQLADELRRHLGAATTLSHAPPALAEVTTDNFEALRAFSKAEAIAHLDGRTSDGVATLLEHALRLDPEFAMAHVRLGVLSYNQGKLDKAADHFARAHALPHRLTEHEKLYLQGWLANARGDGNESIRIWRLYRELYPEKFTGHYNFAMAQWSYRARFDLCVEALEWAQRELPSSRVRGSLHYALGSCQMGLGRLAAARRSYRKARALGIPDIPELMVPEIGGSTAHQVWSELSRRVSENEDPSVVLYGRVLVPLFEGDVKRASLALDRWGSLWSDPYATPFVRLAMAEELARAGETSALTSAVAEVVEWVESLHPHVFLSKQRLLWQVGSVAYRSGGPEAVSRVKAALASSEARPWDEQWRAFRAQMEAERLAAECDPEQGLEILEQALLSAPVAPFHVDDTLARLYEATGDPAQSRRLYAHTARRLGPALAECFEGWCTGVALNLMAVRNAQSKLETPIGRLYPPEL